MKNNNLSITKEYLSRHYGKEEEDISCLKCNFSDTHSLRFDDHMIYCSMWKTWVKCDSFCSHYGCYKIEDKKGVKS